MRRAGLLASAWCTGCAAVAVPLAVGSYRLEHMGQTHNSHSGNSHYSSVMTRPSSSTTFSRGKEGGRSENTEQNCSVSLPLTYEPDQIEEFWRERRLESAARVAQIVGRVVPFAARRVGEYAYLRAEERLDRFAHSDLHGGGGAHPISSAAVQASSVAGAGPVLASSGCFVRAFMRDRLFPLDAGTADGGGSTVAASALSNDPLPDAADGDDVQLALRQRAIDRRTALMAKWGAEARELLTKLGPMYIKFGQMLSIRPDLLPAPILAELQKLCDAVPSFPTDAALRMIEEELGVPATDRFDGLDSESEPIAAASLGQVYKCRLRGTGEEVAVKVQRPDMLQAVSHDLYLLRAVAKRVEATKAALTRWGLLGVPRKQFDVQLLDTFANASYLELDYEHEASNQERFRHELAKRKITNVYAPRVHRCSTTRRVLVSEWIDGEQLAKSPPHVIHRLVPVGVDIFLTQLLDMGFFHSDPHPGNMLVDAQGRLVIIDFGLCAELKAPEARSMTKALVCIMNNNVPGLLGASVELGFLPEGTEMGEIIAGFERLFVDAGAVYTSDETITNNEYFAQRRRKTLASIQDQLSDLFFEHPFIVPDYFALIGRALVVLEGIAVTGDPSFDIFTAAFPYAVKQANNTFDFADKSKLMVALALS